MQTPQGFALPSFLPSRIVDGRGSLDGMGSSARAVACDARVNRKQGARDFQLFENVDTLLKLEPAVRGWQ